jgi:methionyl aminopeptidase
MHEDPQVPNFGQPGKGPLLEEGMVLAIEPMTTAGRPAVRIAGDGWAIFSQDRSLAAHFEFTVAITAEGPRILTPWHLSGGDAVGVDGGDGEAGAGEHQGAGETRAGASSSP